jgi:ribosomal RNA-processing protein 12
MDLEMEDVGDDDICALVMTRFRTSPAPEHKHLCSVAEVIHEQALDLTPTASFAATLSCLGSQEGRSAAVTTALCTFLAMVLRRTPAAAVQAMGGAALQLLVGLLATDAHNPNTAKAALSCVGGLIRGVGGPAFRSLVGFCLDPRPKVRKRAQLCTTDVLSSLEGTARALGTASEVVCNLFESSLDSMSKSLSGKNPDNSMTGTAVEVLHMLGAFQQFLPLLSAKAIGRILPRLAQLLELQQPMLTRCVLDTLQALCMYPGSKIPPAALSDGLGRLGALLASEEKQTSADEITVVTRTLQHGFQKLWTADRTLCIANLPAVFNSLTKLLASTQEEVVYAAAESMRHLIEDCIDQDMIQQGATQLRCHGQEQKRKRKGALTPIERICASVETSLGYQYRASWDMSLHVVTALFDKLGESSAILMASIVINLGDLQNLPDDDMARRKQLQATLGSAVAAMGPEKILAILPLEMDGEKLSESRVWLLPILKQHTVGARLQFYQETLVPVADRLRERARKCAAAGKAVASKNAESCVQSIWALLPSVCNYPSDTAKSFNHIAKTLGDVLMKEPELRGLVCSSLRTLVAQNRKAMGDTMNDGVAGENSEELNVAVQRARSLYTPKVAAANLNTISGYSRNFLPLLFNLFVVSPAEKRGDLQLTIAAIASISDKQTVQSFFVAIMKKLLQATVEAASTPAESDAMKIDPPKAEESPTALRCVFMDLALSLVNGLDDEALGMLFSTARPGLQDKDAAVQKKAYKVLASICEANMNFVAGKAEDFLETLVTSLSSVHSSARGHRLRCLHFLILHLIKGGYERKGEIIATLISEVVLTTKESNKKTRNAAYDLLIEIGHGMQDEKTGGSQGHLMQFFTMIVGCLAGSTPHMVSAAVVALARLLYEFSSSLCHTVPDLLPSALLLLKSKNREIIKSVFGLVKVVIARLSVAELEQHLHGLVEGLILWADDSKNHFKAKVRVIIERLVRRCGMDSVARVMPREHMKLLTNIRKTKERNEKKKISTDGGEAAETKSLQSRATTARKSKWNHTDLFSDDDEDDEYGDMNGSTKASTIAKTRANKSESRKLRKSDKLMLPEDLMDIGDAREPLDLLDTRKTREVLRRPKSQQQKNIDSDDELEYTADGKMIVDESGDKIRDKLKRKKQWEEDHPHAAAIQSGHSFKRSHEVSASRSQSRSRKARKTNNGSKSWVYTGDEYASKKSRAVGDVKKDGKLDPFAYWPLDPKILNRREAKRNAARKGISSVMMQGIQNVGSETSRPKRRQKAHK